MEWMIISGSVKQLIEIFLPNAPILAHNLRYTDQFVIDYNESIDPKSKYINQHFPPDQYEVTYIGDGETDFSVSDHCILQNLFVKENSSLMKHCQDHKIPYTIWGDCVPPKPPAS